MALASFVWGQKFGADENQAPPPKQGPTAATTARPDPWARLRDRVRNSQGDLREVGEERQPKNLLNKMRRAARFTSMITPETEECSDNEDLSRNRVRSAARPRAQTGRVRSDVLFLAPPPPPGIDSQGSKGVGEAGTDSDSQEMLSFLWILRSWLMDCSSHGVPRVIISANFKRKIFWLVCCIISVIFLVWQLTTMAIDVYHYPVTVNLQIKTKSWLEFPTVTVCNANKFKKSLVSEVDQSEDVYRTIVYEDYNAIGLKTIEEYLIGRSSESNSSEGNDTDTSFLVSNETTTTALPTTTTVPTCDVDRDYHGELDYWYYWISVGWWDYEYVIVYEYDGIVSPNNEFKCDSGDCVSHVLMCDGVEDCLDGSDEADALCSKCPANKFQCRDGTCIDPLLRCNSVFDCPDGTDEEEEFCDLSLMGDVFICCTDLRKVSLDHVCDGFDDCPKDKSDQYAAACFDPIFDNVTNPGTTMTCPRGGEPYDSGYMNFIGPESLHDGVNDCLYEVDETCAWKLNLKDWVSPSESDEYSEYIQFLVTARDYPHKVRWYTMANESFSKSLGHEFEDMILTCNSQNRPCSDVLYIYEHVNQQYGNCYSFLHNHSVNAAGKTYGLNFLFNLEVYDVLGLFTPEAALKMYISPPNTFYENGDPFVDFSEEIDLTPGYTHSVAVHPVVIERLPDPFSNCEYYGQGAFQQFQSIEDCLYFCRNRLNYEECGCVDSISYGAPLCTLAQESARECVDETTQNFDAQKDCNCPIGCYEKMYDTQITSAEFPTNKSVPRFFTEIYLNLESQDAIDFALTTIDMYKDDKLDGTQFASDSVRSTFGRALVYFKELTETTIEERPVYDMVTILSNVGGLLGLYMGFSALTVLEIIDFGFDLVEAFNLKGKKKRFEKIQRLAGEEANRELLSSASTTTTEVETISLQ